MRFVIRAACDAAPGACFRSELAPEICDKTDDAVCPEPGALRFLVCVGGAGAPSGRLGKLDIPGICPPTTGVLATFDVAGSTGAGGTAGAPVDDRRVLVPEDLSFSLEPCCTMVGESVMV